MASKKIIWPITPTESQDESDQRIHNFLLEFQKAEDIEIQPVYVLSGAFFSTSEYFEPIDISALKTNMANECANYLSQKFPKVKTKPALILENNFSSQGAEVALFVDYLEQENPDFVVMATHGRSGWTRTFLGSFAESLLLQSRFPTIMIGPDCGEVKALKSGLMPIPLGESSQRFLEKFLDDHRLAFLEKLTLFHKISMVDIEEVAWAPSLFGLTDFSTGDLLTKAKETTEKYLKAFLDHPLSQKRLNYKISESLEPVADVIVEEAKGYDVTVMETQCGSLEATLIGSVARDVIRRSKNPVVVYPHKFQDWVTQ